MNVTGVREEFLYRCVPLVKSHWICAVLASSALLHYPSRYPRGYSPGVKRGQTRGYLRNTPDAGASFSVPWLRRMCHLFHGVLERWLGCQNVRAHVIAIEFSMFDEIQSALK